MIFDRLAQQSFEKEFLSPRATLSQNSKGRLINEEQDDMRTVFQRDRDRIIHSKAFRRLKHKTQVFLSPEGDHYRTRLTHTLEVTQIARTIARALRLNEDLTEAIALAHDLGHTPFGHCGERALNEIHKGGFDHALQSVRVVELLELRPKKEFRGLNLTYEVLDGIRNHSGNRMASTPEAQIIRFADRIAYINHDTDDAIRAGLLPHDVFASLNQVVGETSSERISSMIHDLIQYYERYQEIDMSAPVKDALLTMRKFLFKHLYFDSTAKSQEQKAMSLVKSLYLYFNDNPMEMPVNSYQDYLQVGSEAVKDYVSGMTDRYAIKIFNELYVPKNWLVE